MIAPPIPLPSARLAQIKDAAIASAGSVPNQAVKHVQRMEELKSESRVSSRSSFGGTRSGATNVHSKPEHALVPLHSGPRVVGCTDPALRDILLNVLSQEKRHSILSYGSYSIHIIRVQEHKLFLMLESAPDLLERPEIRDLFLGRPAGGLRFSAAQKPVRSKLGGGEQNEQ